ncbi:MAG: hypothetical protein IM596_07920 [Pseudanabaena sp. M051S1SP2A07QC]|nr:hypothetical protein [Pseudanabaena sp. M109S1SP2A07QC]MCA6521769.1 hypothetical protein [Pseudanabaena sp. M051S1SP2A07QC]
MMTLENPTKKLTQAQILADKQLEAIKSRAIELWGDKWEARLCNAYEQKNGYKHRSRNSKVRAWFDGLSKPTLESFNELLIAVDCEMSVISKVRIL